MLHRLSPQCTSCPGHRDLLQKELHVLLPRPPLSLRWTCLSSPTPPSSLTPSPSHSHSRKPSPAAAAPKILRFSRLLQLLLNATAAASSSPPPPHPTTPLATPPPSLPSSTDPETSLPPQNFETSSSCCGTCVHHFDNSRCLWSDQTRSGRIPRPCLSNQCLSPSFYPSCLVCDHFGSYSWHCFPTRQHVGDEPPRQRKAQRPHQLSVHIFLQQSGGDTRLRKCSCSPSLSWEACGLLPAMLEFVSFSYE